MFRTEEDRNTKTLPKFELKFLRYYGGTEYFVKTVNVAMYVDGEERRARGQSDVGSVDAMFKAILEIIERPHCVLEKFQIDSLEEGSATYAIARVRIRDGENTVMEQASDTDTLCAAAKAFIQAMNTLCR